MENILSAEQSTISSQDSSNYGYVYITENLVNHKKYIGAHKSSCFDESYKGSGKILWRAIEKYGWDNFETKVLKWCKSKEDLYESEKEEIENRDAVNSDEYYNVMPGGHGGDNKSSLSQEEYDRYIQRIKQSKVRPRTQKESEHMERLHKAQIGRPRSEECKRKSRESNLGQTRSDEAKKHMSENHADFSGSKNPFYGKKHSRDSLDKIKKNHKGSLGKVWVTNKLDLELLIDKQEVETYFDQGYVYGRLRKCQRLKLEE